MFLIYQQANLQPRYGYTNTSNKNIILLFTPIYSYLSEFRSFSFLYLSFPQKYLTANVCSFIFCNIPVIHILLHLLFPIRITRYFLRCLRFCFSTFALTIHVISIFLFFISLSNFTKSCSIFSYVFTVLLRLPSYICTAILVLFLYLLPNRTVC